jgi:hypothetical protein
MLKLVTTVPTLATTVYKITVRGIISNETHVSPSKVVVLISGLLSEDQVDQLNYLPFALIARSGTLICMRIHDPLLDLLFSRSHQNCSSKAMLATFYTNEMIRDSYSE